MFTWVLPYLPHLPVVPGGALGRIPMPRQVVVIGFATLLYKLPWVPTSAPVIHKDPKGWVMFSAALSTQPLAQGLAQGTSEGALALCQALMLYTYWQLKR